jgi:hypothetical protein
VIWISASSKLHGGGDVGVGVADRDGGLDRPRLPGLVLDHKLAEFLKQAHLDKPSKALSRDVGEVT